MRHDPEHWGRRDPRGPRGCSGSGGRAERNPVAACGGRISQPAGRRRHSGAQRSPLPIVPRTRTAFPSVAGRGGSEPRRGLPRPLPPGWQGRHGSPPREAKSGDPSRQAGAVVAPSLQPARGARGPSAVAGLAVFAALVPRSPSPPIPPSASAGWRIPDFAPRRTAEQARGKL